MTQATLKKRLEKNYKGSKTTIAYQIISDLINGENKTYKVLQGNFIRPCYTSGSGRFTSNQDHTAAVVEILHILKLKYQVGNDSPRGGLTGNYIKVLTTIKN